MQHMIPDLKNFNELLTTNDLIQIGLFSTQDAAYVARKKGCSPNYIKLKKKILYPKSAVVEFLHKNLKDGSIQQIMTSKK